MTWPALICDAATSPAPPDKFKLIMFNHSLEHVADPVATLQAAAEHLAQGGALLVRIPVGGSYADRRYGSHWVALDPPRHLAIPSQAGMSIAAARAGLTVQKTFFDSHDLQFWASEQYARDIPLWDERSGGDPARLPELAKQAQALNAAGNGDSAGYVLRRVR